MGHRAPSRPQAGGAQLKALADPFRGRAQLRRDETMVRLPAGPLPGPRAQWPAASLDVYRDQSAPRPGPQRRLNSERIGAPPVNHHNPAPDLPPRAAKHPSDSRSPAVSTPQLGYAQLSCQGEADASSSMRRVRVQIPNSAPYFFVHPERSRGT